jgi:hypothetical protein
MLMHCFSQKRLVLKIFLYLAYNMERTDYRGIAEMASMVFLWDILTFKTKKEACFVRQLSILKSHKPILDDNEN